jgi:hypothetical protein
MDHMGDWLDRDDLTEAEIREHMRDENWQPVEPLAAAESGPAVPFGGFVVVPRSTVGVGHAPIDQGPYTQVVRAEPAGV